MNFVVRVIYRLFKPIKESPSVKQEVKVLLIGLTGNGKSTLGNYLLDPKFANPPFETATDNLPKTQKCKAAKALFNIYILKTPPMICLKKWIKSQVNQPRKLGVLYNPLLWSSQ